MKQKITFFLRLLTGAGIIFVFLKIVPYDDLISHLHKINLSLFISAFAFFFFSYIIGAYRWKLVLSELGIKIFYKDAFLLFLSGAFFNLIFPSLIAQDMFRGGMLGLKEKQSYRKIGASLVIDRFSGFLALSLVVIISFVFGHGLVREKSIYIAVLIVILSVFFLGVFIFSRRVYRLTLRLFRKFPTLQEKMEEFHQYLYSFRKKPLAFSKILLVSLVIQGVMPLTFYLVSLSLGLDINPILFLILVPIIMAVALLPVTIAGLGTREAMAVYFFSKIGIEKSLALGISLSNFLFYIIAGLIGGIVYVAFYSRRV